MLSKTHSTHSGKGVRRKDALSSRPRRRRQGCAVNVSKVHTIKAESSHRFVVHDIARVLAAFGKNHLPAAGASKATFP
jgi:hypothetical protein